ncbi:hypothetical protein D9758_009619 [Tetrapyrgos nigripes]|uniref:Uncharacterized protein n=1 Tax=Tetrapyrgos nigripes TaxID=182062 RepID=A0A8H5LM62_9AGAR|nr:hypothetical protein D9758_009619 [Tetrapyrgos nigripes]
MITGLELSSTQDKYKASIDGVEYMIHDTPSVIPSSVPRTTAKLRKQAGNLGLILFCVRGRLKESTKQVLKKLKSSFKGKLAWVVVITGLENESNMDSWWDRNRSAFDSYKMTFDDHACVTAIKGKRNYFQSEFDASTKKIKDIIKKWCSLDTITLEHKRSGLLALLGHFLHPSGWRPVNELSPSASSRLIEIVAKSEIRKQLNEIARKDSNLKLQDNSDKWLYKKGKSSIRVTHVSSPNGDHTDSKALVFVYDADDSPSSSLAIIPQQLNTTSKVIIVIGITGIGHPRKVSVREGYDRAKGLSRKAEFIERTQMDSSTLEEIFDFVVKKI